MAGRKLTGGHASLRFVLVMGAVLWWLGCDDPAGDSCPNGACDNGETSQTCPQDCPASSCPNGACDDGETSQTCPQDCGAPNTESTAAACDDGLDNDGDNDVDCDDSECAQFSHCGGSGCQSQCTAEGNVIICDEQGNAVEVDCPDTYGSACQDFGGDVGFACACGSVPTDSYVCHDVPEFGADTTICDASRGFLVFGPCPREYGSTCQNNGCTCGTLPAAGACEAHPETGDSIVAECTDGVLSYGLCPPGSECRIDTSARCVCTNASDGICPEGDACPTDPDCGGSSCAVTSHYSGCRCSDCGSATQAQSCYVNSSDPVCTSRGFSLCWKEPGLPASEAICTSSCAAGCGDGSCHESTLDGARVCIGYEQ